MNQRDTFSSAATTFTDLVASIAPMRYDDPGLGGWDLRALVGHTSRALVTVASYLAAADEGTTGEDGPEIDSPEGYLAAIAPMLGDPAQAEAIDERGRAAGATLGTDPHATVVALLADATLALESHPDDTVLPTIAGTMRLVHYLPTRTFELVVHTLDLAHALGRTVDIPSDPLTEALTLAVRSAAAGGRGPELLRALTGREPLDRGFSIV